ncbi:hypothetical protein WI0192307A02_CDS0004 [Pseudomonas phage KG853]
MPIDLLYHSFVTLSSTFSLFLRIPPDYPTNGMDRVL